MKPQKPLIPAALAMVAAFAFVSPALAETPLSASVTIHADKPGAVINPDIFGQFAEHLGRGIYKGIWVGKHSKIPNTRRLPQRRGRCAQGAACAGRALAGRLLRR